MFVYTPIPITSVQPGFEHSAHNPIPALRRDLARRKRPDGRSRSTTGTPPLSRTFFAFSSFCCRRCVGTLRSFPSSAASRRHVTLMIYTAGVRSDKASSSRSGRSSLLRSTSVLGKRCTRPGSLWTGARPRRDLDACVSLELAAWPCYSASHRPAYRIFALSGGTWLDYVS